MNDRLRVAFIASILTLAAAQSVSAQSDRSNDRTGLWGSIGVGVGVFGCLDGGCGHDTFGFSGLGKLGGTLSPSLRFAVTSNGFYRDLDGVDLSVGTLTGLLAWHPSAGDLFLNAGVGAATASASATEGSVTVTITEGGVGFVAGAGYDLPLNRTGSLAISPFLNWVVTTAGPTYDFIQAGAAVTFN